MSLAQVWCEECNREFETDCPADSDDDCQGHVCDRCAEHAELVEALRALVKGYALHTPDWLRAANLLARIDARKEASRG